MAVATASWHFYRERVPLGQNSGNGLEEDPSNQRHQSSQGTRPSTTSMYQREWRLWKGADLPLSRQCALSSSLFFCLAGNWNAVSREIYQVLFIRGECSHTEWMYIQIAHHDQHDPFAFNMSCFLEFRWGAEEFRSVARLCLSACLQCLPLNCEIPWPLQYTWTLYPNIAGWKPSQYITKLPLDQYCTYN